MFLKYICHKAVNTLSDFYVIDKGTTAFMWRKVLGLSRPGIEPPDSPRARRTFYYYATAAVASFIEEQVSRNMCISQ